MSNIRRLFDKKDNENPSDDDHDKPTDSFAGGHRSGLAVEYPGEKKKRAIRIQLYSNGFIVGDGPFRTLAEPANASFLAELRSGSVPEELRPLAVSAGGDLPVEMAQFEGEYDPANPPTGFAPHSSVGPQGPVTPKPVLFGGHGAALGGLPASAGSSTATAPISSDAIPTPQLSGTSPTTVLQLRLPGGARVARTFDQDASGASILTLLSTGLDVPEGSIVISSGFPPKPMDVVELGKRSIFQLGLCNSAINVSVRK